MEALAISSLVSAGTPPPVSLAKSVPKGAIAANGEDLPFAQVVRNVLDRKGGASSGNSSSAPAATPSKLAATPIVPTSGKSSTVAKKPAQTTSAIVATTTVNPVSLPEQLGVLALPVLIVPLNPDVARPSNSASSDVGVDSTLVPGITTSDGSAAGAPTGAAPGANSKENALLVQAAALIFAEQVAAQPAAASAPASTSGTQTQNLPASSTPAPNVPASDTATATSEGAKPSPQLATGATEAPALGPQSKPPLPQIPEAPVAATDGEPIMSLLPQVVELRGEAAAARQQISVATLVDARAPVTQNSQTPPTEALGYAAPEFLGVHPAPLTILSPNTKGLTPVLDIGPTIPPAQPSSSAPSTTSDRSGSQDASSDRKDAGRTDATTSADSSTSTSAIHDAPSFSQALAASSSVKQDDSPAPSPPSAATVSAPSATPDRSASSAAPTPQAAPAPGPSSLPLLQGTDGTSNRLVSDAKLLEAAGRSEMRIAMDTDKLGPVELRARMIGDEVGAAITVEKRDAHAVLAVELPALQQALSDKQLRVEQVTLLHASLGSMAGDAGASARQDSRNGPQAAATPWLAASGGLVQMFASTEQSGIFDSQGRLSVHA